ncbi:MAG: TonB-dependent receptor [Gammaproteobacteria bacterium]|nr:TonB-dependent receptor [Gammaproteobacteria bacterium]
MQLKPFYCNFLCIPALAFFHGVAHGEDLEQPEAQLETVVVVGTRAAPRTATDAPVPVDAIDAEALLGQGSGDMSNLLRTTIPSFHVSTNPSRDAAALLRPVNLRGLAPDHTLVLVNNKRRHRGAVIQWISNGASDGAQGPDISAIPAGAIKRVEVLRDGAAAQYGSDAIAGVVNFVLRDDDEGGSLEAKYGFHTEDTSEDVMVISANRGFGAGTAGFANLSLEYTASASTDRSVQHPDAVAMQGAGVSVANPAKPWGDAEVEGGLKAFLNTGFELDNGVRGYAFGNYTTRDITTAFFYRSPQGRSGVYVSGGKILIGGGPACKARYDYAATPENVVTVRDLLRADDACFAFAEILPEGFTPAFGASMTDMSAVGGFAGSLDNGLTYDVSVSYGRNNLDFFIHETVNASYGPATPRSFDIGANAQTETNFNVDLTHAMDVGLASDLNVAAGFEWRDEGFRIVMGEPLSWDTGPFGPDGFSARSNGFGGFNPASAGEWDRANIAAYVDLEADVNDRLRLGGALRWEDFDDFGSVANYKLAGRLQVSDAVALRASVGSGFRAPTPGQQNANNLSTVVDSATGVFREQGTVASTNPVALALGGAPLDAESSDNFTLGFLVQTDAGLDLTVDLFRIDLADRIALSDNLTVTDALRGELIAAGVAAAQDFNRIRYFTNDYDTRTTGLDVVLTQSLDTDLGVTNLLAGFNRTLTSIEELEQASTASRVASIERGSPGSRVSLAVSHATGSWDLGARLNYFGSWFDSDDNHYHDGYQYLDLSVKYAFDAGLAVVIGADNVLDAYPDEAVRSPSSGRLYPRYSPAGYNGRLMYGRLRYAF